MSQIVLPAHLPPLQTETRSQYLLRLLHAQLVQLGNYLRAHGVSRVAMEATGVYWIPLHDHLSRGGFEVTVFNGAHARNLPGRKTDVADCQWHAMLHSHGLLSPCFIPADNILELRSLYRLREDHVAQGAM